MNNHPYLLIDPEDIDIDLLPTLILYLQQQPGWTPKPTQNSQFIVFITPPDTNGNQLTMVLPHDPHARETQLLMASTLTCLAVLEKRPVVEVVQTLQRLAEKQGSFNRSVEWP